MSRANILASLTKNQPEQVPLPSLIMDREEITDLQEKFKAMAEGIGSKVIEVADLAEIPAWLAQEFPSAKRLVTLVEELVSPTISAFALTSPHDYEDVDVAIFKPTLAVAENSALWLTEDLMGVRVLPFITQHIVMLVDVAILVPDMHAAYQILGDASYGYGAFISGPSKTADIEQSLVLGAHGPRSMTVFIYDKTY
ncbi:L-lactate dehydrogenase complex protein LldG [Pedobacter sp. CAN_A7]|uniref:LutC/YkgG family protein n=1 Tax=Pedobacter sp. CAN_A7 TaxID=2787722 RepID=UPI0018C9C7DA